jgi:hypothetical protein
MRKIKPGRLDISRFDSDIDRDVDFFRTGLGESGFILLNDFLPKWL